MSFSKRTKYRTKQFIDVPQAFSEIEKIIETEISLAIVSKNALRTRKIETIQRKVETTLKESKGRQNKIAIRVLAELAMISYRRKF